MIKKRYILSAVISIAILAFLFYRADFGQVISILATANPVYVLIAACFPFIDVLLKSLRWKFFLDAYKVKIKPIDVISTYLAALFVANVTPARVGEAARPYFLKKKYKVDYFRILPAIVVERFLDLTVLLLFALLFFMFFSSLVSPLLKGVLLTISLLLLLILIILLRKKWAEKVLNVLFTAFGFISFVKRIQPKVKKMFNNFYKGVGELRSARLVEIIGLTLLTWLGESMILYLAALSLGIQLNIFYVIGFFAIATLGGVLSSLPGGLGSFELLMVALLGSVGYSPSLSLSIAILYRFLSYGIGVGFSSIFFFREIKS